MNKSGTNQKHTANRGRLSFLAVPSTFLAELALAFMDGAEKYGGIRNFIAAGASEQIYLDAAMRHIQALAMGERRDWKTGIHHAAYGAADLGIVFACEVAGTLIRDIPDDRGDWATFVERARELVQDHGDQATLQEEYREYLEWLHGPHDDREEIHYEVEVEED